MLRAAIPLLIVALVWATAPAPTGADPTETGLPFVTDALDTPDRIIAVEVVAMACPAGYDSGQADDVCLGYDGRIPGPTWVFQQGESVRIDVTNHVAATVGAVTSDPAVIAAVSAANVSLHRHGIVVPNGEDGVSRPPGTQIADSSIGPGMTRSYSFVTAFPGAWHYHDHTMFHPGQMLHGPERGLFGTFVTLPSGVATTNGLDVHVLDLGVAVAPETAGPVPAGERLDLVFTGLGNYMWDVRLSDPSGTTLGSHAIGPGVSRGITLDAPAAGTYTWRATSIFVPGSPFTGTVVVA